MSDVTRKEHVRVMDGGIGAKGDIAVADSNGRWTRKPIGEDGQIPVVDSSEETGVRYADPAVELNETITTIVQEETAVEVVALVDDNTIAINVDAGKIFAVTLGGNRTLDAPTGEPVDGQLMEVRVRQDGTGNRTLAYNAVYRFGTDVTSPTLTTTAAKTDYLLFQYCAADGKWDCIAVSKGY